MEFWNNIRCWPQVGRRHVEITKCPRGRRAGAGRLQSWVWQIFEIRVDIASKSFSVDNHIVFHILVEDTNFFEKFEEQVHDRLKDDALTTLCQNCKRRMSERKSEKALANLDVVSGVLTMFHLYPSLFNLYLEIVIIRVSLILFF